MNGYVVLCDSDLTFQLTSTIDLGLEAVAAEKLLEQLEKDFPEKNWSIEKLSSLIAENNSLNEVAILAFTPQSKTFIPLLKEKFPKADIFLPEKIVPLSLFQTSQLKYLHYSFYVIILTILFQLLFSILF